ncbi:hypothetical protein D9M71_296090 [compost metagenome]
MRQREGVSLPAHLDHQAANDRQGQRYLKMEATALPCHLGQFDRAAQLADQVLHRIQPHTAPGHFGNLVTQAETGQEQERQQLRLTHPRHRVSGRQGALDDAAAQALQVDTGAIVDQLQAEHARLVRSPQADHPLVRLARQQAPLGQLDAVVDGIAQQVGQRCFELFQHIAVDLGLLPFHHQPHRLAQRTAQVADHAALPGQHVGKRPHPTGQGGVIQQLRTLTGLPAELIQVGCLLLQNLLGLCQQALGLCQGFEHLTALPRAFQLHAQAVKRLHTLAVHALEALKGSQVWLEPLGFHQRLAGQVKQAIKAVSCDTQYPLSTFASALASLAPQGGFGLWFPRSGWHYHRCRRQGCQRRLRRHGCSQRHHRHGIGARVEQAGHLRKKHRQGRLRTGIAGRGNTHQQVGPLQQRVNMLGGQPQSAFLGRHQAVFHHVGDTDASIHPDNARCPLERVGSAHAGLELVGLSRVAFQCHQAGTEHLGLRLGLQAEQFEQRCVAHLLWGHDRLRCTADSKC